MSKYTTGEMAKLCGVSVRTVQYYDSRSILVPSELSEGGRRLYSDDDLRRLKIICFLRELDLPIRSIGELLAGDDPGGVIALLLDQQERALRQEIEVRQTQLQKLEGLKRGLKGAEHFSVESIGDIAYEMEHRKKLRRIRARMIFTGVLMDLVEAATLILWIAKGIWQPFAAGMCLAAALGVWISAYYYRHTAYICPQCHTVFRPSFREVFFAPHTPSARRLTCRSCGRKGYCAETYGEGADEQ